MERGVWVIRFIYFFIIGAYCWLLLFEILKGSIKIGRYGNIRRGRDLVRFKGGDEGG